MGGGLETMGEFGSGLGSRDRCNVCNTASKPLILKQTERRLGRGGRDLAPHFVSSFDDFDYL